MRFKFESSVNSEGIETNPHSATCAAMFESSVNSEGIETGRSGVGWQPCLRAV